MTVIAERDKHHRPATRAQSLLASSKHMGVLQLWWPVCVLACTVICQSAGKQIPVGGDDGWTPGRTYKPVQASVGDSLVFKWTPGQHNVAELTSNSCDGAENAVLLADITATPAEVQLTAPGTRNFTCSLPNKCAAGMLLQVVVYDGPVPASNETHDADAQLEKHFQELIRPGVGHCDPVAFDNATGLHSVSCYSPPITLQPGQIEDAFYFLPSPYPEGKTVGAVRHTSAILNKATSQEVPLSEVYMHHIFGPGDFLVGEGAEHRGSMLHPSLQAPYYTTIPADKFTPKGTRLINVHVISTLGVPEDKVLPCIECWCQDDKVTSRGKLGGGACCSSSLCPSTLPNTTETTYLLQYNVSYRELQPGMDVSSIYSLMLDAVGGRIEYDIQADKGPEGAITRLTGALDARCPQAQPLRLLRCLGHQHIGGRGMRMLNNATGEVICQSDTTYGSGPRDQVGNETGYLVAMSLDSRPEPLRLAPGTVVTLESNYTAEDHFGVMALMFVDFVGFDTSCPGAAMSKSGPAFGPDFAHQKGTAFGFYDGEPFGMGEGDAPSTAIKDSSKAPEAKASKGSYVPAFIAGGLVGAASVAAAVLAVVLHRRYRQKHYFLLSPPASRNHSEQA